MGSNRKPEYISEKEILVKNLLADVLSKEFNAKIEILSRTTKMDGTPETIRGINQNSIKIISDKSLDKRVYEFVKHAIKLDCIGSRSGETGVIYLGCEDKDLDSHLKKINFFIELRRFIIRN